jgi:hypothetical protein
MNEIRTGEGDYTPWLILALEHAEELGIPLTGPCCRKEPV